MLGVTISLNERTVEENCLYLEEMKKLGCSLVFTSLRIPEENPEKVKRSVEKLGEYISDNYQSFVVDVSPRAFELFTISWMKENHITTLRIDNGISEQEIVELSKDFDIIFNASTLTNQVINELRKLGFSKEFIAWHNYYPRKNSGLDETYFIQQNQQLTTNNVKLGAYIPGNLTPRGTIYEWLPTLEKHRQQSPFSCYLEMVHIHKMDTVIFGDYGITKNEMDKFSRYFDDKTILVNVEDIKDHRIFDVSLENRIDVARDAIRCVQIKRNLTEIIYPQFNEQPREFGNITIDNHFYGRYMGELQILCTSLPADSRVNVVARVTRSDYPLLPILKMKNLTFQFQKNKSN